MKMSLTKLVSTAIGILLITSITSNAQEKRAQTTFKFVSTPLTAKAAALSDGIYSIEGGAESMFANPATMSRITNTFDIVAGQVSWIADINYNFAAFTYAPKNGLYGVFGVQVVAVDYGDLDETIRADNNRGYIDLGSFSPRAYSIGLSYARAISNQFSIGGSIKYLGVDFGSATVDVGANGLERQKFDANVIAYDFGIHYKTGFKSLQLGFAFKNLAPEVEYSTESSEIPLTFRMGISMDVLDFMSDKSDLNQLIVSLDTNRPRDFDEQIILGLDYTFMKRFSLRAGYLMPSDEQGASFGAGLNQSMGSINLKVDYSYTTFGVFSNVNRFTVQFGF